MRTGAKIAVFVLLTFNFGVGQGAPSLLTGHYEGTATTKNQEVIPLVVDVDSKGAVLAGRIATPQAIYSILSGTQDRDKITITLEADGNQGMISGTLSGAKLVGVFTLGEESGSIDLTKKSATPLLIGKSPFATPIVFLGVYHMDNPGLDEVNLQADDVLTPKRQQELQELVEKLSRFKPTVIGIEAPYGDHIWPDRYRKYLAGQYTLGRNEIEQIGFRLGKFLSVPTVYGIDYPMFMNGLRPDEMAQSDAKEPTESKSLQPLSREDELLRRSTITEYLSHLNSAEEINKNPAYMGQLLPNSNVAIYAGADMVANWYKRNLRIFSNINRIVTPGQDRVLVIIGMGHLKLLKQFASDASYFQDVDVEPYLKP